MRKLLGFLLLLVIIAGGGAYYYLTFVFPEREVVATLQQVADDLGAEFAYDDIKPGPLGLNGRITNARFAIPRVETGATFPSKKDEVAFDEISYSLDPVWMLKNIPTIYKLRAITHYKSLAFEGFESTESADEYVQLESLTFEDLDYSGYALKLQEDPAFKPSPDEFKSIENVQELFWVSGMSVEGFKMKADGVTAFIDHHAIRDISDSGIGAFEINDVSVTSPGMAFSIDSVDIQNLKVPMGSDAAMEDIFTTADKFEINSIQFSMDGFGAYAVEQIYIRESDHATLQNGMRLPTKTETGIVGLTLPTTLFASSPEIYPFFTINEMENLVIDMTGTGTIDLETGEAGSKSTLRLRELAALSMGMKMGGLTGALFDEFAETIEQSLAAEMPALDLTADEITDFLRALTDPILKGTSPEGYELPELPPMPELEAFLDGAIKDVALTGGSIEYEDLSLFSKLNAYFVGTGMTPDEANLMLSQTVAMLAITAVGIPVAEETATGLYMMTESPGSFVVEFDITPPVSFGEVMGLTESDEVMNTFLMTDWSERIQSTLVVKDSEGNEVDLATGD